MLHLLYKVMQPCTIYRGVAITNNNNFYNALGNTYQSLQQAKMAVDASYGIIATSIKKTITRG